MSHHDYVNFTLIINKLTLSILVSLILAVSKRAVKKCTFKWDTLGDFVLKSAYLSCEIAGERGKFSK
jgi:hypothetical protein